LRRAGRELEREPERGRTFLRQRRNVAEDPLRGVARSRGGEAVFSFEKLEVYQRALDFLVVAHKVIDALPRGYSALGDQLKRAALSIATNIAEGAGRPAPADQARHYGIARGSAMECAAILGACARLHLGGEELLVEGRALLISTVSMLTKMCRR
jgi:four helix bundle protein